MPEHDLRLLALDGGGVRGLSSRGLSSLFILKQLMETVDADSPPKPCEYFDMIGGTSAGGLIAIMLGRLQMTVDESIDAYASLLDRVFQKRRHRVTLKGRVRGRFDTAELERALRDIIAQRGFAQDALLSDSEDAKCKVFVCATSMATGRIVQLRSYRSPRGRERKIKIWEAARATSAALSFFDPITIDGDNNQSFTDGATGANNPVYETWYEAQDLWSSASLEKRVKCMVSIGTGVPSPTPFGDDPFNIGKNLLSIITDTERTAETFHQDKSRLDDEGRYYRFNVSKGLENLGPEDSKQKNVVIGATDRYIESQAVFKQMKACANKLSERQSDFGSYRFDFALEGVHPVNTFVGRTADMETPEEQLLPTRQMTRPRVVALHGLSGKGKTQPSIESARRQDDGFSVFSPTGRSEDGCEQSVPAIASKIPKGQRPESSKAVSPGCAEGLGTEAVETSG